MAVFEPSAIDLSGDAQPSDIEPPVARRYVIEQANYIIDALACQRQKADALVAGIVAFAQEAELHQSGDAA